MSAASAQRLKGCLLLVAALIALGVGVAVLGVRGVIELLEGFAAERMERMERNEHAEPKRAPELDAVDAQIAARWKLPEVPPAERGNSAIASFRSAKRDLYALHEELALETTFYCACRYHDRKPDHKSCGYAIRKRARRAKRTEVEHVMPASRFGRTFESWSMGHPDCARHGKPYRGRECAEQVSETFALMESDLYNLQPTVGEINGDRLHYEWGEIRGERREYGACDIEIKDQRVEPPAAVRGDIARTYLYMAWAYPERVTLSVEELERFARWDREDPPSEAERARARRIASIQGNRQPFIR